MKKEIEKMDVDVEQFFDRVISILEQARGNDLKLSFGWNCFLPFTGGGTRKCLFP